MNIELFVDGAEDELINELERSIKDLNKETRDLCFDDKKPIAMVGKYVLSNGWHGICREAFCGCVGALNKEYFFNECVDREICSLDSKKHFNY